TGARLVVEDIAESQDSRVPIAAFLVPDAPEEQRALVGRGIPTFHTPESCADALAAILSRRIPGGEAPIHTAAAGHSEGRWFDEAESYALVTGRGITVAPYAVISTTEDLDSQIAGLELHYPVVAK